MNAGMRKKQREMTMQRRRKPNAGLVVHIPFEGSDDFDVNNMEPPAELHLDATGPSGETAIWLDDYFWLELIRRWSAEPLTIHFHPTPKSLLHPTVIHQLKMLRRVAPKWRLVGHCYLDDLAPEGQIAEVALAVHHEIRIMDAAQPGDTHRGKQAHPLRIQNVVARIRRIQAANDRTTPIIVCCRRKNESHPQDGSRPTVETDKKKSEQNTIASSSRMVSHPSSIEGWETVNPHVSVGFDG